MPTLTVNNNPYIYPDPGTEPGWGDQATGWAEEVTTVLSNLSGADDILETTFNVANNITVAQDVVSLVFNTSTVRSAVIEYSIYRTTTTTELAEKGTMEIVYKNGATPGTKWTIGRSFFGDDAGLEFSMTDAGQFQYISTNLGGTSYSGVMRFEAKAIQQ